MNPIINKILRLRSGKHLNINTENSNRHCIQTTEEDGTTTAYYFGTPIYDSESERLLSMRFTNISGVVKMRGSNADITIADKIILKNNNGYCSVSLRDKPVEINDDFVAFGIDCAIPTTNGIAYIARTNTRYQFIVEANAPIVSIKTNDKSFSFMRTEYCPFATISMIGSLNSERTIIAPAVMDYQELGNGKFRITIYACDPTAKYVMFEVNLYEPKLFQDTTVESKHPTENNAFGGTAFIGNTKQFGEQWLYTRVNNSIIPELLNKHITRAILHIPQHNNSISPLKAHKVSARFCSFGSNWENKIPEEKLAISSFDNTDTKSFDITRFILDANTNRLLHSEGMIIKTDKSNKTFNAISTGDCYFAPQILEIHYDQ